MALPTAALLAATVAHLCTSTAHAAKPPKLIITALIDDLGSYDTAVNNPDLKWLTPNLHALSHDDGMQLDRLYVYMYCSPTRRAYLTGRYPVHMGGNQAQPCDNALPWEMTLLPQKLKQAPTPFANHFIGKGHLGYPTTDHLPFHRGFDSHAGYLAGAEDYDYGYNEGRNPGHDCGGTPKDCIFDFWHDDRTGASIHDEVYYSTNWYTERAVSIIKNHTTVAPDQPLWIHLMYQGVHSPYVSPPPWEVVKDTHGMAWPQHPFVDMLSVVDSGFGNITATIRGVPGLWEETLLIITSDNGGIGPGNNFPFRGMKATPWEGGTKVMGFISGGFLPASLRGSTYHGVISVADWYPTVCNLAGVADCSDNATIQGTVRPIDGVDLWPRFLSNGTAAPGQGKWAHEFLPTTQFGIIFRDQFKMLQGAPSTNWYTPNDTHVAEDPAEWPCQGNRPPSPPSPSPPGPAPSCSPLKGWDCKSASYCGPGQSFYWSGAASLDECEAKCQANATCTCFDWKASDAGVARVVDGIAPGGHQTTKQCRLHAVPAAPTHSSMYTAYWRANTSSAASFRAREDEDYAKVSALAASMHSEHSPTASRGCQVCSHEKPCLFDLLADPGERTNLAASMPSMVATLQAKLASFPSYVGYPVDPAVLAKDYVCEKDLRPWWGNFSGPCCIPKPKH